METIMKTKSILVSQSRNLFLCATLLLASAATSFADPMCGKVEKIITKDGYFAAVLNTEKTAGGFSNSELSTLTTALVNSLTLCFVNREDSHGGTYDDFYSITSVSK
jgi:hypothetical protein